VGVMVALILAERDLKQLSTVVVQPQSGAVDHFDYPQPRPVRYEPSAETIALRERTNLSEYPFDLHIRTQADFQRSLQSQHPF
jgi:hypothetical protein